MVIAVVWYVDAGCQHGFGTIVVKVIILPRRGHLSTRKREEKDPEEAY